MVESFLATYERGDLLEQVLNEWTEITEKSRPRREGELVATEARLQKTQDALERYFLAFEEGKLREELCTARIEELPGKLPIVSQPGPTWGPVAVSATLCSQYSFGQLAWASTSLPVVRRTGSSTSREDAGEGLRRPRHERPI